MGPTPPADGASASEAEPARTSSVTAVLRTIMRSRRPLASGLVACAFLAGLSESVLLGLIAHAATAMVEGESDAVLSLGPIEATLPVGRLLALGAGLAIVRLGLQLGLAYLPARLAADVQAGLRRSLLEAYVGSSWEIQSRERDGHLQELLTSQVVQATQALQQATTLISSGLTFATLVVAAFVVGPAVAVLVLVVGVAMAALLRPLGRWGRQQSVRLSRSQVDYAGAIGSALRLAEETYLFGSARAEQARIEERILTARHHYLRTQFAQRLIQGLYQSLVILLLVGGLAGLQASGTGQIAELGTVVLILARAASYGQQAQYASQVIQQSAAFLDRLRAADERYRQHPPIDGALPFPPVGDIEVQGVAFSYRAGEPILQDVSLRIRRGSKVGIVGTSGSGKSTLMQILLRMRHPDRGVVRIGEVDMSDIDLRDWRAHVACVPQDTRLLDATVAENIRFAREISHEAIERAARLAHVHEVIERLPQGYETPIGQRVDALSGGQRQRVCLARALAGDPDLLILDEPTSALDAESEEAIRASLEALEGPTVIIVAHRPSLLEICEQVYELRDGRAVLR